jgi:phenylacetate-CoA ligase
MPVFRHMQELDRAAFTTVDEHSSLVQAKLQKAVSFAGETVPYYRDRGLRRLDDFPILTKHDIWENFERLVSDTAQAGEGTVINTSGSTGRRLKVVFDRLERGWRIALAWYGISIPGVPGEPPIPLFSGMASLWGASELKSGGIYSFRKRVRDLLIRQRLYGCYMLSRDDVRRIHSELSSMKPAVILGYVSNLRLFAQYARECGLLRVKARKVVPTAESLDPLSRNEISGFFDAPIRERYGCREAGGIAVQCEYGTWHIFDAHLYPEVLRDDGTIVRSGEGRLLLTKLNNRIMPLVRYNIEDRVELASLHDASCACGRSFPILKKLLGREVDLIRFPDGETLHGLCVAEALRGLPAEEFVFVQDGENSARFYIAPRQEFTDESLKRAMAKLDTWVKGRLSVTPVLVQEIPAEIANPTGSGKRLQVVNLWERARAKQTAQ